ncbi:MAG: protein kinase [Candidatus Pseudobacter hemicellulosilyticus]|uniref:Protein kinase n=1 Tax=Candidatus Pseudobacter hemicellulosilyticus TaxID=3121375 RepID=A0AAJ5WVA1_9BACT|nr:MAG: protein kinase [Pseudobacter sp.]
MGTIEGIQGWILHVSVIPAQMEALLTLLLPVLQQCRVTFKIVRNIEVLTKIQDGDMGGKKIGKSIKIYPGSIDLLQTFAAQLVTLTAAFRGPAALTDFYLGGSVYARFGAYNPIVQQDQYGQVYNCIQHPNGQLVEDVPHMPAAIPWEMEMPFGRLPGADPQAGIDAINQSLQITGVLKEAVRGSVFEGYYTTTQGEAPIHCVVKQGCHDVWVDEIGKDMTDRMLWQQKLHDLLQHKVKLPKVLGAFTLNRDRFLILEFIDGRLMKDELAAINTDQVSWPFLNIAARKKILTLLLSVAEVVALLHQEGIVHRDVTPGNFILCPDQTICLIDIELAYSIPSQEPAVPYRTGTEGFRSGEQLKNITPTLAEDVFALGATILFAVTGFHPTNFDYKQPASFRAALTHIIQDQSLAQLVASCMHVAPARRPATREVITALQHVYHQLEGPVAVPFTLGLQPAGWTKNSIREVIQKAIDGLAASPTTIVKELWCAPQQMEVNQMQPMVAPSVRFYDGILGVIHALARAKSAGYDLSAVMPAISAGWQYVVTALENTLPRTPVGLLRGAAGVAYTLAACFKARLMEPDDHLHTLLTRCLSLDIADPTLGQGLAGQGLALLAIKPWVAPGFYQDRLQQITAQVINGQVEPGVWMQENKEDKMIRYDGWWTGNAGIIGFLLECPQTEQPSGVEAICQVAIDQLLKNTAPQQQQMKAVGFGECWRMVQFRDAYVGRVKVLALAYQLLKDQYYKHMLLEAVLALPPGYIGENFSLENGTPGILQLLIDGYQIDRTPVLAASIRSQLNYLMALRRTQNEHAYWGHHKHLIYPGLYNGTAGVITTLLNYELTL